MTKQKLKVNIILVLSAIVCLFFGSMFFAYRNNNKVFVSAAQKTDSYYCVKDTNFLITDNQDRFGNCWTFGSTNALESYIAKTTGLVYDFSEAWISLCRSIENSSLQIGQGGDFNTYYQLATKYGLLLESEFPYEMLYNIDSSNKQEIFDMFKDKTHKEFLQDLNINGFYSGLNSGNYDNDYILSIKDYLINYGALSISYDEYSRVDKNICETISNVVSNGGISGHQISLIGWDDNYSFTDKSGNTQTGVFICLNNWGTDDTNEIFYISYNDICLNGFELDNFTASIAGLSAGRYRFLYGFEKNNSVKKDFDVSVSYSNSSMINYEVKKCDSDSSNDTTGVYENKNIYYYGEDINQTYSYTANFSGNYDISVRATKNQKVLENGTELLLALDKTNKSLNVIGLNCDSGEYVIYFDIDKNNDGIVDISYPVEIFVFSGAEIGREMAYAPTIVNASGATIKKSDYANVVFANYNKVLSSKETNVVYGFTSGESICYYLECASVNTMKSVNLLDNGMILKTGRFTSKNNSNTEGELVVQISGLNSYKKYEHTAQVNTGTSTVTIKFVTYKINSSVVKGSNYSYPDKKVFAFYDLDGGSEGGNQPFFALGQNYASYSLINPTKKGYNFDGWYLDKNYTTKVNDSILTESSLKQRAGDNNADDGIKSILKSEGIDEKIYKNHYVTLYAKWTKEALIFENETLSQATYGDQVNFDITPAKNGSNNYTYELVGTLPQNLSFDSTNLTVTGQIKQTGNLSFQIKVTDNDTGLSKTATFTVTINARKVTYKIHDKQSSWGQDLVAFTGEIISGTVLSGDDLNIEYECDVTKFGTNGSYTITATSGNLNYDVTFINGTYRLQINAIQITAKSYVGYYDGNYHEIELVYDASAYPTLTIEYSFDNVDYTTEKPIFKDFTDGQITVYIKVSATGYSTSNLTSIVDIKKKRIEVVWTTGNYTYTGWEQYPIATVSGGVLSGDQVEVEITGAQINAGVNYEAVCSSKNINYEIINNSQIFSIGKAMPYIDSDQINNEIQISKEAIINAVTWGDLVLPANYRWKDPDKKLVNGKNENILIYIPEDTQNYNNVEINYTVTRTSSSIDMFPIIAIAVGVLLLLTVIALIVSKSRERAEYKEIYGKKEKKKKVKPQENQVLIKFVTNSPIALEPMVGNKREISALPQLQRNYYEFCGWYTDKLFLEPYKSNGVEPNLTLYAKWKIKM